MAVRPGGCSGYSYDMFFDSEVATDDSVQTFGSVRVVVDPDSAELMKGAVLDYQDGLQESGFHITNPNVLVPAAAAPRSASRRGRAGRRSRAGRREAASAFRRRELIAGAALLGVLLCACGGEAASPSSEKGPAATAHGRLCHEGRGPWRDRQRGVVDARRPDDPPDSAPLRTGPGGRLPRRDRHRGERALRVRHEFLSGTLTPVDLVTGAALRAIRVGKGPAGVALAPNGAMAYVTDAGTAALGDTVTPVELPSGRVLKPIKVGGGPQGIAITPNGRFAYVVDAGAIVTGQVGPLGTMLTPVDLSTCRALAPITVGNGPVAVAVAPGGATAYVANLDSESVSPIDLKTNTAGAPIPVDGGPLALAIVGGGSGGSAGSTAYVVNGPAGSGAPAGEQRHPDPAGHGRRDAADTGPEGAPGNCRDARRRDGVGHEPRRRRSRRSTSPPTGEDRRSGVGGPFAIAITERSQSAHSWTSKKTGSGRS